MLHKIWNISLRVISILSYYFQIKSSILLENHASCNFLLKYYITVSIRQFTKHFNEFFVLIWGKRKFENLYISKIQNSVFVENCCIWLLCDCHMHSAMKQLLEKLHFEFLNFSCTWHKEASYCPGHILAVSSMRYLYAWGCPFLKCFQILYISAQIFKYVALSCPFFASFLKNRISF